MGIENGKRADLAPHRDVFRERAPTKKVIVGLRRRLLIAYRSSVPRRVQVIVHVSNGNLEFDLVHSFREFHRRGQRRVGLGVDSENTTGATKLYESVGMVVDSEQVVWEKELA